MRLLSTAVACLVWVAFAAAAENAVEETVATEYQPSAHGDENEQRAPLTASVALLAVPLPALLEKMNSLQRQFFQAVLPESWAIPRYDIGVEGELRRVRSWMQEAVEALEAPSASAVLNQIQRLLAGTASHDELPSPLQRLPPPPALLQELARTEETVRKAAAALSQELMLSLPTLDVTRVEDLAKRFSPQKLEWPVETEGVSLFLPVVAPLEQSAERLETQLKRLLKDESASVEELLVPLTGPTGELLFAKLAAVFKGVDLPKALTALPIALVENLQASDLSSLWSAIKLPIINRELLLASREAHALWGPSMGLASLPRVSLALEGVPLQNAEQHSRPSLAALLQRASATVKSQMYRGSLDKVQESSGSDELSDLSFLNLSLPVVAVARSLVSSIFSRPKAMSKKDCTSEDGEDSSCQWGWMGVSETRASDDAPSQQAPFSLSQQSILKLFSKVETLAAALASAVAELQLRIEDVLQSQLTVSASVPTDLGKEAVAAARRGVKAATTVAASLKKQLTLAKLRLEDAFNPTKLLSPLPSSRLPPEQQQQQDAENQPGKTADKEPTFETQEAGDEEEEGLLSKRRRRRLEQREASQSTDAGIDVTRLLTPGGSSLLDLASLKSFTDAVAALSGRDIFTTLGIPLSAASEAASRISEGASLRELFSLQLLPAQVLEASLAPLASNGDSAFAALAGPLGGALNLGQTLALSEALDNVFSTNLADLPSLQQLALNPTALAAAVTRGKDRSAILSRAVFRDEPPLKGDVTPVDGLLLPSLLELPRLVSPGKESVDSAPLTNLSILY